MAIVAPDLLRVPNQGIIMKLTLKFLGSVDLSPLNFVLDKSVLIAASSV
ncbi:MAG: hypothetical protein HRT51_05190 [Colwellia sp.]|nr:hypothetical protein [Colwellia sp.]